MSANHGAARAIDLRRNLGLTDRTFDLEALVADLEIKVGYAALPVGTDGLSIEIQGQQWIILGREPVSPRRRRFTLAHELGHWMLAHPSACGPLEVLGRSSAPEERAANEFAANLLMPPGLFRKDSAKRPPRMGEIQALSELYSVSRAAAALRFIKFTDEPCALVSIGPESSWVAKSDSAKGLWIDARFPDGYTYKDLEEGSANVAASAWITKYPKNDAGQILEEILPCGFGSWLVLLSDLPSADESCDLTEAEADEELQRRRHSFRRY